MTRRFLLTVAAVIFGNVAYSQDVLKPKTAPQVFADARDLVNAGSFEVAADMLKDFLALAPAAQDYLDIEAKYGPTTFLKLRTIPRWYDDPKREAEFKKATLEPIVQASIAANETLLKNPNRVAKFIRNLSGPPEESNFAIAELKRSGDFVVPQLVEALRLDADAEHRASVLRAIVQLGPETVPGLLAAAEGMKDEFRLMLLGAIAKRPDLMSLTATADTNILPSLWRLAALPADLPNPLRALAQAKLKELLAGAYDRRRPAEELTAAARQLYDHKARFLAADPSGKVKLWSYDSATDALKSSEATMSEAEEVFGLKYLRWALEQNANFEPALELFLALATEKAVERIKFGNLAESDPNAFRLLAAAPASSLIRLLDSALTENRTALALGVAQALGDRAEPSAGNVEVTPGGKSRPPVLVKALDFPDPRVQIAAALALLKIPNARHGAHAKIVEVLKRAVSPDAGAGTDKGKAIVADPSAVRGDRVANLLRAIGYQVELVGNGRQLVQRIDRAADFDLILIDRHIVEPTLADLVPQVHGSVNTARRPLLVVASPDAGAQPGLETLLVRLAALIAMTETVDLDIPPLPVADRRKPADEIERALLAVVDLRDRKFRQLYDVRLARLQRLVEAANLRQSTELKRRLEMRLPQLTMAALVAEYDLTPTSAPKMVRDFTQLTDLIRRQTDLDASVKNLDTMALVRLVQQLEGVLTPELKKAFDVLRTRLDDDALALARDTAVDASTRASLVRLAHAFPGVAVIREPYSKVGFEDDVNNAMPNAAERPRDPKEKAASALAAVKALAKLANGSIPGYDVAPAADSLRGALANDALVPAAADALSRLSLKDAQADLVKLAADSSRKPENRGRAARAAIRSVQAFGKLAGAEAAAAAAKATGEGALGSELAIINALLSGSTDDLAVLAKAYRPTPPPAPKEATPPPKDADPMKPKDDPMKPKEGEPAKPKEGETKPPSQK